MVSCVKLNTKFSTKSEKKCEVTSGEPSTLSAPFTDTDVCEYILEGFTREEDLLVELVKSVV